MKPTKCTNCKMFYDADKYEICPHCNTNSEKQSANNVIHNEQQTSALSSKQEHQSKGWHLSFSRKKETSESKPPLEERQESSASEPISINQDPANIPQVESHSEAHRETSDENSNAAIQPTSESDQLNNEEIESDAIEEEKGGNLAQAIAQTNSFSDTKTVAFYNFSNETNPVVGWLVCIKGEYIGESFKIVSGRNNIGRSLTNDIALAKEKTVSRERHASIVFEPTRKQFFIQPGESSGLTYLNNELIMNFKELADRDKIDIGAARFMFVQLCSDDFSWDEYI